MTDSQKQSMLSTLTGEKNSDVLFTYLKIAAFKICRRAYPYDVTREKVPPQYDALHVEIAAYLLNKRGAEGEMTHSENGISRSYENADVPDSLMRQITPLVSVLHRSDEKKE